MKRVAAILLAISAFAAADARATPKSAASGETQVVAKIDGREITLSELRIEMARLGLMSGEPNAERIALESLMNRHLLARRARAADLHRKPEAMMRMHAAQDQALADHYLALASQPPEPTRAEIDDYIAANPTLFGDRRIFDFSVLTLETKNFNEKALTPLFDEEPDFSRLESVLEKAGARYAILAATQSGAAFPGPIREQLGKYQVNDNIVLKGEVDTQIMKITRIRKDSAPGEEEAPLARQLLLQEAAQRRAEALMVRLKKDAAIAYYRRAAAPLLEEAKAD